jgi:Ca-activated chloride channel homolog
MLLLQQIRGGGTASIVPLIVVTMSLSVSAVYGQFASRVDLVEVYATVTDRQGQPIEGLEAADFRVAEDGVPQTISTFAADEFPLAVALAIDRSFSMGGKGGRLVKAREAARAFVAELRPPDRVMVIGIGSDTETVAPLSADRAATLKAIDRLDPWGTTPLHDATLLALDAIQSATGRRALVLLSDGSDRYSEASAAQVLAEARQRDVLVYAIALGAARPPLFAELASATGGRSFFAPDARDLTTALSTIARELRFQYLLGYEPKHTKANGPAWHAIEVTVGRADVQVRARDGYLSR